MSDSQQINQQIFNNSITISYNITNQQNAAGFDSPKSHSKSNTSQTISVRSSQSDQKQKLIKQNIRLKQQLQELVDKLKEIKQIKQFSKNKCKSQDEQKQITDKNHIIKVLLEEIQQINDKIQSLQRQLDQQLESNKIREKEDELQLLKKELYALNQEKFNLMKNKQDFERQQQLQQQQSQPYLATQDQDRIFQDLKEQLRKKKEENRTLSDKVQRLEKRFRKLQNLNKQQEEQLRLIQQKVKEINRSQQGKEDSESIKGTPGEQVSAGVTEEQLQEYNGRIEQLMNEKKQLEKKFYENMHTIEKQKKDVQAESEKFLLLLKEKQKEHKLTLLKNKELSKLQSLKNDDSLQPKIHEEIAEQVSGHNSDDI